MSNRNSHRDGHNQGNRIRAPPHLKGREIGMFYRNLRRNVSDEERPKYEPILRVPEELVSKIREKLSTDGVQTSIDNVCSEFEDHFESILKTDFDTFVKRNLRSDKQEENSPLDELFSEQLKEMKNDETYKNRLEKRNILPVTNCKDEILKAISESNVILISGDTGCGKTTQVPQFILDDEIAKNRGSQCNIICTQPRRISAISIAERVAWERCERLGKSVGYNIRMESVKPRDNGSLVFCTTGTLLRRMQKDPLLNDVSHVILDEIHERNIESDILLVLLKRIHQYRPSLKLILMSATFSFETFSKYFENCKVFQVQGSLFPVEEKYLEDAIEETQFHKFPEPRYSTKNKRSREDKFSSEFDGLIAPYARNLRGYSRRTTEAIMNPESEKINIELIEKLIFHISETKDQGGILVFLPGYGTISDLLQALTKNPRYNSSRFWILPLHSMMQSSEQKRVFDPAPNNVRKVVLATTIAETSITIDDIVYVINSGKIKCTDYDIERNCQTLEEQFTTLSNSRQRRGRAGRVRPGICYHLYTRAREMVLDNFPTPEIQRSRLEGVILNFKVLHLNNVEEIFKEMIDKPNEQTVLNGLTLLKRIEALDENETLTPLGLHLAHLPVDPQMGKMLLLGALFQCIDPVSTVASSLSHKEPFYNVFGKEHLVDQAKSSFAGNSKSDHLMVANVVQEYRKAKERSYERDFAYKNFISIPILKEIERMKVQFLELLQSNKFVDSSNPQDESSNLNSSNENLIRAIIAAGLYPNVAFLKHSKRIKNRVQTINRLSTPEDSTVQFHRGSTNDRQSSFESKYFVFYLKRKSNGVSLLDSSMVYPMALVIFGDRVAVTDRGISVGHMNFRCNENTTKLILEIRRLMDNLLKKKALYPSPIENGSSDAVLLDCLKMLLQLDDVDNEDF